MNTITTITQRNTALAANKAYRAYEAYKANKAYKACVAYRALSLFILLIFILSPVSAQIKIGGNVYGGGNQGNVDGTTTVNVRQGNLNKVFGGARMANVGGNSYVNVDGAHASGYMVINYVYGGNDIAGHIGTAAAVSEPMPAEVADNKDGVDDTWNSYVHISAKTDPSKPKTYFTEGDIAAAREWEPAYGMTTNDVKSSAGVADDNQRIYIGQAFAGGNGDYYYEATTAAGKTTHNIYEKEGDATPIATRVTDEGEVGFTEPVLAKTYMDVQGGSIVYAYGGGNNATVSEKAVIHVDNPTKVVSHLLVDTETGLEAAESVYTTYEASEAAGSPEVPTGYTNLLSDERFRYDMGINTGFSFPSSDAFQIGRFFGGNNKAEMAIRPTWNLQSGKIRNLYSGGNKGSMTSPEGLLLEVRRNSTIIVDNLYGGCRMADVYPKVDGIYIPVLNLPGYNFPDELSARVLVRGGDINNVYGGNDVTGKVYGGNAIGIYASVRGDVYGGGNGAYPYTDNPELQTDDIYGDFFYETDGSWTSLNAFRPNAEQVSIRLHGEDANYPTIVGGSVFLGGNCATLETVKNNPLVELVIGSHVIADQVYLGNNGERMIDSTLLSTYYTNNSLSLKDAVNFAGYMKGAAMSLKPTVRFDSRAAGSPDDYIDYTSYIGSLFCGGNVGSMTIPGKSTLSIDRGLVIYEKLVGGCNNARVEEGPYNAAFDGGLLGSEEEEDNYMTGSKMKDRLELNLDNVVIQPKRWDDTFEALTAVDLVNGKLKEGEEYYTTTLRTSKYIADGTEVVDVDDEDKYYKRTAIGSHLEWNTAIWSVAENDFIQIDTENVAYDDDRRLMNGNVYGGCYNSGHVNGNVIININQDLHQREILFAETTDDEAPFTITGERRTGVVLDAQSDDVMAVAMTVFGAGYGEDTEVWGNTTVNLNQGYAFQVFGGGELGVVGKQNGSGEYEYNAAYSTTVNLKGLNAGYSEEESGLPLAETEFIYGAGNEGDVCGDSYVYLGNGRIYDAFAGASNADIYGATEVHIGYGGGYPWVRDNVYGGNDFGGTIKGFKNHRTETARAPYDASLMQSSTYVKYIQGRVDTIFGGNYGNYDYADPIYQDYTYYRGEEDIPSELYPGAPRPGFHFPHLDHNSLVHFAPVDHSGNAVSIVFGGSVGFPGHVELNNAMQEESYVLLDDTKTKDVDRFANMNVFGGGAFAGLGTSSALGAGRTAIDLFAGGFHNIYGGSNREGLIGYTRVNVPSTSTARVNALYGGGQGYSSAEIAATPTLASRYCDNYVTCIDFEAPNAIVEEAIYGGNQNSRISVDTYINMQAPAVQSNGYQAEVYGAGNGALTVSARTNLFMNNNSVAYKVFGGGRDGAVMNYETLTIWLFNQFLTNHPIAEAPGETLEEKTAYVTALATNDVLSFRRDILDVFAGYVTSKPLQLPAVVGTYPNPTTMKYDGTFTNDVLTNPDDDEVPDYYNTNVHLMDGSDVTGYAYGGGFGSEAVVSGTTYVELKGGRVDRDIYGGGQGGSVYDAYNLINDPVRTFVASTNVLIEGGTARNVYGGGYLGHVGKHVGEISESNAGDIPAVANVTIGKLDGVSFYDGIPAILRNAYGGGEGGSVYGTANLTINNGYIGYRYKNMAGAGETPDYQYVPELNDQKPNDIVNSGNAFGGGYVVNSYVDNTNVEMYGGIIRGSLYGGGEVGPIGRGTIKYKDSYSTGLVNGDARIFKAGKTSVKVFDGLISRNVFGGGRGHDSWGGDGTMYMDKEVLKTVDLKCKGYVFGQTDVTIHGGEIGTDEGQVLGYGNVFGGGDIGSVYGAFELADGTLCVSRKPVGSVRYDEGDEGYYYKHNGTAFIDDSGTALGEGAEKRLTEDCQVVVEPWCKATAEVTINGKHFTTGSFVPTSYLNYLGSKNGDPDWAKLGKADKDKEGIIIHNAVFAGGNTSPGSTEVYANTTTVFGNATASIHDVYHRDLITIGRGRVGGLYGDGNLTLVDGYRELNITNYGTDYYHISSEITKEQYEALPKREAAYYEIRYRCISQCTDDNGKTYAQGSTITSDEIQAVFQKTEYQNLEPILDGEGNPVLDEHGFPTFNTVTGTSKMLDSEGKPNACYWVENGVCSRYAGRPMNTIQRADFCGVFGSRMVMQGAQDRVPETVDYTNYTINRVREVSLNKKVSVRSEDTSILPSHEDYYRNHVHGNYFGIYSVVNFLGALTSDVDFHTAIRITDNSDASTYQCPTKEEGGIAYGAATYHDWKEAFHSDPRRNNGNSHNKVALASGVYLELTNENGTGTGLYEKKWGLITGVVELDLINVQTGMGGGYVYARNEHGIRGNSDKTHSILTDLNKNNGTPAVTNKAFTYDETENTKKEWETSGNFVHSTQRIIDDCYDIGGKYLSGYDRPNGVPAHYWFIKGSVYIYDQYISAYTGSPNAFSETVNIPLSITSASHGRLTLLNVQPARYAYYSSNIEGGTPSILGEGQKVELRDIEYQRNDAINYWEYSTLAQNEKNLFVPETYVVMSDCTYGDGPTPETFKAGTVLLPGNPDGSERGTYYYLRLHAPQKDLDPTDQDETETAWVHHVTKDLDVGFDDVFRPSNNISHETGYILTYNVNNPSQWYTWYTPKAGAASAKNQTGGANYEDGPTYRLKDGIEDGMVLGQTDYKVGAIISDDEYYTYVGKPAPDNVKYPGVQSHIKESDGKQATFHPAYIVTVDNLETTKGSGTSAIAQRLHKGATLSKEDYTDTNWAAMSGSVAEAYVVTSTVQLSKTDFIYRGTYMTAAEKEAYKTANPTLATEIDKAVLPAYYCTDAGKYGGNYYEAGYNYRALAAYSAMSESDRQNFTFNYDALDLLIDSEFSRPEGMKFQYDGNYATAAEVKAGNKAEYSIQTPIDYTATYKNEDESLTVPSPIIVKHKGGTSESVTTVVAGDTISRVDYEALPNERQHYSAINVADVSKTYYVVKKGLVMGDTPYAAGQVISSDTYADLNDNDKTNVTKLNFTNAGYYYYCHSGYAIDSGLYADLNKGKVIAATGVTVTDGTPFTGGTEYSTDVPAGIVIAESSYRSVINKQTGFAIHGQAPTETSTLYVARGADINNLSAEKIITAIYKYDYIESDMDGMHLTPFTEYHVLNIHLNFKSGIPTVEDIQAPDIILPGTSISIPEPYVTPGAYEITGGGWKLFDTKTDAESHINGIEITPISDPLYLYQNGYYLAYYAKTYLGETFSNAVPVSVANYHDLKDVIEAVDHHYYIDHKDVHDKHIEPKIYINNYSGEKDGLDIFKDLYDLSLVTSTTDGYTVENGKITEATGTANTGLIGHTLLNTNTRAGSNLEFFLRTDIDHADDPDVPNEWTPIGTDAASCFEGTFHGDGHTLRGLDNSLFGWLCGNVYNLGVMGSFTSAGVADHGDGYVESCWVKTTSTTPLASKPYPIFGNPSRGSGIQLVNSYYSQANAALYDTDANARGTAIQMNDEAFYNGEVAYDLNNFYLYKRYSDHTPIGGTPIEYKYWKPGEEKPQTGRYASHPEECSSGTNGFTYVEDRFADGDFRYAAGTIPSSADERMVVDPEDATKEYFYPIWPDDYLFFGQRLNYGYSATYAHDDTPTAIVRSDGRLSKGLDANRVYRVPAYYRSRVMNVAHFNPHAYLAQRSKDGTKEAHPNMTAIDFAGHNDMHTDPGLDPKPYELGLNTTAMNPLQRFYAPLLDDDGLLSIVNVDETQNLLVYAPAEASASGYANKATHDVLTAYFADPTYDDYYDNSDEYRIVTDAAPAIASIYGHLVQDDLVATNDHLLVDKQDFNAPIAYDFDGDHRMWYQRVPEEQEYVDFTKGWQDISLPFTAELVTTSDKGEITHFYGGSATSMNGTDTKLGHEYWLREFSDIQIDGDEARGTFGYPAAIGDTKRFTNTFLWDYYYNHNVVVPNQQDANRDTYQTYYQSAHDYENYPLLTAAKPYLIGFPSETYYEFDLSGRFEAKNTVAAIDKLSRQTITFASDVAAHIRVSDDETAGVSLIKSGSKDYTFTFKPSYLKQDLGTMDYALNSEGNAFDHVTAEGGAGTPGGATVLPFRPYFTASAAAKAGSTKRQLPTRILFIGEYGMQDEQEPESAFNGGLEIYVQGRTIITKSTLKEATPIRIVNLGGVTVRSFIIQPGETIETPVQAHGAYIVNRKKVFVR